MTLRDVAGPGLAVSLAGVLLVAVIAARLLGVKRPIGANLVSGLVGWLAGLGLSLIIARGQANPDAGFTRNLWVFSIVFTMGATVFAEMLARPGALARAQSGLAGVPHPTGLALRPDRADPSAPWAGPGAGACPTRP
jgi:hypothetical protein